MKVRMKVGQEGPEVSRTAGQVYDVPDAEGDRLVAADFASVHVEPDHGHEVEDGKAKAADEDGDKPKKSARKRQADPPETATEPDDTEER